MSAAAIQCPELSPGQAFLLSLPTGERITLMAASVGGNALFAGSWISVPAGASVNVANAMYLADSTGPRTTFTFPTAPADSFSALISLVGATNPNGVALTAGAGDVLADPQNPGQFVGFGVIIGVGLIYAVKYQGAPSKRWGRFV